MVRIDTRKVAILVGIIDPVLHQARRRVGRSVVVRGVSMAKNGYRLTMPSDVATAQIERYACEAPSHNDVAVIVTPFFRAPAKIEKVIDHLAKSGAHVVRMKQGRGGCPKLIRRMDAGFQEGLTAAIADEVSRWTTTTSVEGSRILDDPVEYEVALSLLRGLASHDKLGRNNHSHEDDMWKLRGRSLQSKSRRRIEKRLLDDGILARKRNKSRGGTGWVYWIADVQQTVKAFPELSGSVGGSRR